MKIIIYQLLIIFLLLFSPFNSVLSILILYGLVFFGAKKFNPLNPVLWLFLSWNILFINAFSGVMIYNSKVDLSIPIAFCVTLILVFLIGFFISNLSLKHSSKHLLNNFTFTFSKISTVNLQKTIKNFSFYSIFASFFLMVEIIFIYNGNILDPATLRAIFNNREATLFSQLAGILYFGGLFSIAGFLVLRDSKYRTWYLIGAFSFAIGSVLSAGRQMVFQLILSSIMCYSILKFYQIKINILKSHKYIFSICLLFILGYFVFISTARNTLEDRTKSEIYSSINNSVYSKDFSSSMEYMPSVVEDFFIDYIFYFSHEIYFFSEWWYRNDISIIDFKFLRFSPFIERQIDRVGLLSETQQQRYDDYKSTYKGGSIIEEGWPSTNMPLLENVGFLGAFLMVFFHGFFSNKLFIYTKNRPNFGLLNLSIANNIIIFNTITNSAFSETQVLFYIIVSFYFISKKT